MIAVVFTLCVCFVNLHNVFAQVEDWTTCPIASEQRLKSSEVQEIEPVDVEEEEGARACIGITPLATSK